jgi:hypothetical protein
MAKETLSLPDDDAALQEKAAYLIDHCGPLGDKARPYPVQRLQIELPLRYLATQHRLKKGSTLHRARGQPMYQVSLQEAEQHCHGDGAQYDAGRKLTPLHLILADHVE